jgi:hypothetical protein
MLVRTKQQSAAMNDVTLRNKPYSRATKLIYFSGDPRLSHPWQPSRLQRQFR